jgi:hypothetical protein
MSWLAQFVWALAVLLALPAGALSWEYLRITYFRIEPLPPVVKIVKQDYSQLSMIMRPEECSRICRARWQSAKTEEKKWERQK